MNRRKAHLALTSPDPIQTKNTVSTKPGALTCFFNAVRWSFQMATMSFSRLHSSICNLIASRLLGDKTLMPIAALIFIAALVSACSATYKQNVLLEPSTKLVKGKSVLIATPADRWYGKIEYAGSGRMTALATQAAFARFSNNVSISADCKDLACLKKSASGPFDYYVIPEILHWEDRATEWSRLPDKIEVKIMVYDGGTGKELASTLISGESKLGTFGGDHPQDLLPEPLNNYVESLY